MNEKSISKGSRKKYLIPLIFVLLIGSQIVNVVPVSAATRYNLTVRITGEGSVSKSPNQSSYSSGTSVTLTATPDPGWVFAGWSGSVTSQRNPITLRMYRDRTVRATFVRSSETTQYSLTVSVTGSGSVTKSPSKSTYSSGETVQLTATPASGYTFTGWSGAASGTSNPLTVTMNANKAITATFKQASTTSVRLNPTPWRNWAYWHHSWVIESHTFPTGGDSTLTASDIGQSHSGLSLAITRQDLKIPLKGKDLWVKFTVAVKGVSNSGNWLRSAIVARIDPLSGEQASLSKYTEYDFYQGSNTNPRTGGNFELWELPFCAADSQFQTYTVHLTPNLVTDWGQTTYDNYMLNYLAPTIEMNNAGMTILVQDVELWNGMPP